MLSGFPLHRCQVSTPMFPLEMSSSTLLPLASLRVLSGPSPCQCCQVLFPPTIISIVKFPLPHSHLSVIGFPPSPIVSLHQCCHISPTLLSVLCCQDSSPSPSVLSGFLAKVRLLEHQVEGSGRERRPLEPVSTHVINRPVKNCLP